MYKVNKLKKLGWDSLSFRTKIIKADMVFVTEDLFEYIDELDYEDKYFTRFCIDIYATNEKLYKDKKIGVISGYFFTPCEYIDDDCNFLDIADSIGTDIFDMAENITGEDGNILSEIGGDLESIAYIDEFYINKKYRNIGIGSYILNNLKNALYFYSKMWVTSYIVLPQPRVVNHSRTYQNISDKNKDKHLLTKMLINFYEKNGFRFINKSNYMLRVE